MPKKETTNKWAEFLETGKKAPLAVSPRITTEKKMSFVSTRQRNAILRQGGK